MRVTRQIVLPLLTKLLYEFGCFKGILQKAKLALLLFYWVALTRFCMLMDSSVKISKCNYGIDCSDNFDLKSQTHLNKTKMFKSIKPIIVFNCHESCINQLVFIYYLSIFPTLHILCLSSSFIKIFIQIWLWNPSNTKFKVHRSSTLNSLINKQTRINEHGGKILFVT